MGDLIMKTRQTSVATAVATAPELHPVPKVHRKHPISIAVSMALLAAAATSAMAAESTAAPAENAGAQGPAQQNGPTTSAAGSAGPDQGPKTQLETIVITGVRESQEKAIEVK